MAALQCDICGGKLMAKAGGIFECDSCGMQYDKTRIQEMVQEIKGTVKVEGTVEVTGTVKVEGGVSIENLLKRGNMALEDFKWEDAKKAFQDALNINAECGEAYLGLLLAEQKFVSFDQMLSRKGHYLTTHASFKRALQFMDPVNAKVLRDKVDAYQRALEKEQEEQRQAQEEKERLAQEQMQVTCQRLEKVRARIAPAQKRISHLGAALLLKADGTVIADTIDLMKDHCNVQSWRNIKAVSAGMSHSVGLRSNGTVVVTQYSKKYANMSRGEDQVGNWKNIVDISAGWLYTVGVTANGKVLATGNNSNGQCNVSDWENIVAVSACHHTVGLKADGTAVATGSNLFNECRVENWTDLVAVSAGQSHTVGLKADGTVVAVGENSFGQCNVYGWEDIVAVSTGSVHTVGLKADGTVVTTGDNDCKQCDACNWTNMVAVVAGNLLTLGITADGRVRCVGNGCSGLNGRILFRDIDTLPQELEEVAKKMESRKINLQAEQQQLLDELPTLKGLFAGKRRKEIEARLAQIETELKELK